MQSAATKEETFFTGKIRIQAFDPIPYHWQDFPSSFCVRTTIGSPTFVYGREKSCLAKGFLCGLQNLFV